MGMQQSKAALLYEQVNYGNANGIRALRRDGADLEWIDKEGKTPLILASMRPDLLHVAALLIELGANVNAYRPGSHAGTPLHHATKRGLVQTVELLLSHGANPLLMNDDCQTALDLARAKSHWNVVRLIESRIGLFSGWLREANWPSMLEAIVRQWVSRKIWVVVLPCDSRNSSSNKFELAIYPELQAAQPRVVIALWKFHIEEPIFSQSDPAVVIVDKAKKTRYKFLAENEGDKQQLRRFYDSCRGMTQLHNYVPAAPAVTTVPSTTPVQQASNDVELTMAINASIQSAIAEGVPIPGAQSTAGASNFNGWGESSSNGTHNGWGPPSPSKVSAQTQPDDPMGDTFNGWAVSGVSQSQVASSGTASGPQVYPPVIVPSVASLPSAPPMAGETFYGGPIHYPSIDSGTIDLTMPTMEGKPGISEGSNSISGSCVICLDAPVEGACIPCGHVAGCMSCLSEIKKKKWGCPVCRANIDQVIKLYAV